MTGAALEINQRPIHDLRALIELIGQRRVERELNVHRTTIRRWLDGRVQMPGAQRLAVRSLLGDLPGTEGRWTGWRFHDGELLDPEGNRYRPGEIRAIGLTKQLVDEQRRTIEKLRTRVAVLEHENQQSANDWRAA